jgi:hypothetical protein
MVSAMKTMLACSGVRPACIKAEAFTGFDLNTIGRVTGRIWRRFIPFLTML